MSTLCPTILIPPPPSCLLLLDYFKAGLVFHFTLILLFFLSSRVSDGLFSLLSLLLALYSLRSSDGISFLHLRLYSLLLLLLLLYSLVAFFLRCANSSAIGIDAFPRPQWQINAFDAAVLSAPPIYAGMVGISVKIQRELQEVVREIATSLGAGGGEGEGGEGGAGGGSGRGREYEEEEESDMFGAGRDWGYEEEERGGRGRNGSLSSSSPPSASPSPITPFSGTPRRL